MDGLYSDDSLVCSIVRKPMCISTDSMQREDMCLSGYHRKKIVCNIVTIAHSTGIEFDRIASLVERMIDFSMLLGRYREIVIRDCGCGCRCTC